MKNYAFFRHADLSLTGLTMQGSELQVQRHVNADVGVVEGVPPLGCHYVKQQLVDGELEWVFDPDRKPARPGEHHAWDAARGDWIDAGAAQIEALKFEIESIEHKQARAMREHALGIAGGTAALAKVESDVVARRVKLQKLLTERADRKAKGDGNG